MADVMVKRATTGKDIQTGIATDLRRWRFQSAAMLACTVGTAHPRFLAVRDLALLLLLAHSAMRVGELTGLKLADIETRRARARCSAKTRCRRTVAFPARTGKA